MRSKDQALSFFALLASCSGVINNALESNQIDAASSFITPKPFEENIREKSIPRDKYDSYYPLNNHLSHHNNHDTNDLYVYKEIKEKEHYHTHHRHLETSQTKKNMNFKFSRCNENIDTTPCNTPWSHWITTQPSPLNTTLTIPCGTCITIDDTDGRQYDLPHGLDIVGKLHIAIDSHVVIRASSIIVQGVLKIDRPLEGTMIPESGIAGDPPRVRFILAESTEGVLFYPDSEGDNAFACGTVVNDDDGIVMAVPCNVGKMPFVVAGGRLDVQGIHPDCPSWVRLVDVSEDMRMITVGSEAAACWGPGAEVLLTSDSMDWSDQHVVTVLSSDIDAGTLTLTSSLPKAKTSLADDPNFAVEAALLSRDIEITAENHADYPYHGGHFMVFHTPSEGQILEGVLFRRMGQRGNLGRYPIHFHMCEDVLGTIIKKNVIRDSNQRCVVIHGTHNATIEENVAFDTFGHCYMLEDGGEFDNRFVRNLGAMTRIVPTEVLHGENGLGSQESDDQAATFWFANPANYFIGNVAAGSEHVGIWIELRSRVRGVVKDLGWFPNMNPKYQPTRRILDNVAHSNPHHGMTLYQTGWRPKVRTVWENCRSYKNGHSGLFLHATEDMTIKNGFFADNMWCIRNMHAERIHVENIECIGESNHLLSLLDSNRSWSHCTKRARPQLFDDLAGISFQINEGEHQGVHLRNITFSGFNNPTHACNNSAALFYEREFLWDGLFDNVQHLNNITFVDTPLIANRISACRSLDVGHRNMAIEDRSGTIGPSGGGHPGFFVQDDPVIMSFINRTTTCTPVDSGTCLRWCEGACLRLITLETNGARTWENVTLEITKDDDDPTTTIVVVVPRSMYYWDGQFEKNTQGDFVFVTEGKLTIETKRDSHAYFGLALPSGTYDLRFRDTTTGRPVWPDYVRKIYGEPPSCWSDDVTLRLHRPDSDGYGYCHQLIKNPDLESGVPDGWQHNFCGLDMMSPGADGSRYAVRTENRADYQGWWRPHLGTALDVSCLWHRGHHPYKLTGKFQLYNNVTQQYVRCDSMYSKYEDGSCPELQIVFKYWIGGELVENITVIDVLETLDDGTWLNFEYEVEMPVEIETVNEVYLRVDGAPGMEFFIDDWSMTKLPSFFEQISSSPWMQVSGKGYLNPEDPTSMLLSRSNFVHLFGLSKNKIIWRRCKSCKSSSHRDIYYRRWTPVPETMDLLDYLENNWNAVDNCFNVDFSLYSTYQDALDDVNRWTYCNFNSDATSSSVGFPRECGPSTLGLDQWSTFTPPAGQADVAFMVEGTAPPSPYPSLSPTVTLSPTVSITNLALDGLATQSCTHNLEYPASKANDGDTSGNQTIDMVSKTCGAYPPYWLIDLGWLTQTTSIITEIHVHNRKDQASIRLSDFWVEILNEGMEVVWSFFNDGYGGMEVYYDLAEGVEGRFVRVRFDRMEILTLGEVQVYGRQINPPTTLPTISNLALTTAATATQSCDDTSLVPTPSAPLALDDDSSYSRTCHEDGPSWTLDLGYGTISYIYAIDIISGNLENFTMTLRDDDGNVAWEVRNENKIGAMMTYGLDGIVGRYVEIRLNGLGSLVLNQVSILGNQYIYSTLSPTPTLLNLAPLAHATQTCTTQSYHASLAIDSNPNANFDANSVAATCSGVIPWWKLDWGRGGEVLVKRIVVRTRGDCCWERFRNYAVEIMDEGGGIVWSRREVGYLGYEKEFLVDNGNDEEVVGRYVRIRFYEKEVMYLAEVEVWGTQIQTASPTPSLSNLALNGRADQSCTFEGYDASRAIDGSTVGGLLEGSTSSTCKYPGQTPWFRVDLGAGSMNVIYYVTIYAHLSDYSLELLNHDETVVWKHRSTTPIVTSKTITISGTNESTPIRYVQIQSYTDEKLILTEVQIFGYQITTSSPTPTLQNLALGRIASQTCDNFGFDATVAGLAVDGNRNGDPAANSVAITCGWPNLWWRVDLGYGSVNHIYTVIIYNRSDGRQDDLQNFVVEVLDEGMEEVVWSYDHVEPCGDVSKIVMDGVVGRFVQIRLLKEDVYLALAEVEVMGYQSTTAAPTPAQVNIAPFGTAMQICDDQNGVASLAVDENYDAVIANGHASSTCRIEQPWWALDLGRGGESLISKIVIHNSEDWAGHLADYIVEVLDDSMTRVWMYHQLGSNGAMKVYHVDGGVRGRYVRIIILSRAVLALAEVEIWGTQLTTPLPSPTPITDIAFQKPANQSSTCGGDASLAVDGNTDGKWTSDPNTNSVTNTCRDGTDPWWIVDIETPHHITDVVLYKRTDCCRRRLRDFAVDILDEERNEVTSLHYLGIADNVHTLEFNGVVGRYVRVRQKRNSHMSLAEVIVHGFPATDVPTVYPTVAPSMTPTVSMMPSVSVMPSPIPSRKPSMSSMAPSQMVVNLALEGRAMQVCDFEDNEASRAIDGDRNGNLTEGSVAMTCSVLNPWLKVDLGLGSENYIKTVHLYNRRDCCGSRLANYGVMILDSFNDIIWEKNFTDAVGEMISITIDDGVIGRYVQVQIWRQVSLQLAEVEVMGYKVTSNAPTPAIENLALNKLSISSSTCSGGSPEKANDGNTDGTVEGDSMALSCCGEVPWWKVDLLTESTITEIHIYNKESGSDLRHFFVEVLDEYSNVVSSHYHAGYADLVESYYYEYLKGRYVQIRYTRTTCMEIAEVIVNGWGPPQTLAPTQTLTNVALMKESFQSCTMYGAGADRVNDGNTDGDFANGSVSETCWQNQPWWRVDLGATNVNVVSVIVYNRVDAATRRLQDFDIQILNENTDIIDYRHYPTVAEPMTSFYFGHDVMGRFVQVKLRGDDTMLTLAEVEVFGYLSPNQEKLCYGVDTAEVHV